MKNTPMAVTASFFSFLFFSFFFWSDAASFLMIPPTPSIPGFLKNNHQNWIWGDQEMESNKQLLASSIIPYHFSAKFKHRYLSKQQKWLSYRSLSPQRHHHSSKPYPIYLGLASSHQQQEHFVPLQNHSYVTTNFKHWYDDPQTNFDYKRYAYIIIWWWWK